MKNKTTTVQKEKVHADWHFINADGQVLGRLATDIAKRLIGKGKENFVSHINMGDKVVVTNASKIEVTGRKMEQKLYHRHSMYPKGHKSETLEELMARKPTEVLRKAVKGMLPKNKLQDVRMANLYIYEGDEHPHTAHQNKEVTEKKGE